MVLGCTTSLRLLFRRCFLQIKSMHERALIGWQSFELLVKSPLSKCLVELEQTESGMLTHLDSSTTKMTLELFLINRLAYLEQRLSAELF